MRIALLALLLSASPWSFSQSKLTFSAQSGQNIGSPSLEISNFTAKAAEVLRNITAARYATLDKLKAHQMEAWQAQIAQDGLDAARALWQKALDACHADKKGNCKNPADTEKALSLLNQAQRALP